MNKYHAKRTTVDGITFDSKREAKRYVELQILERAGRITNLQRPKPYQLVVNGVKVGRYTPDFTYVENGVEVVEDVKSPATKKARDYRLRKMLMLAIYGISIKET